MSFSPSTSRRVKAAKIGRGTCASAYCQIPRLDRGMRRVGREMMRMAEQCLDLINADSVLLAFGEISFIPIEPGNCRPAH